MAIIASNFKTNHTRKSTALFINEVNDYLKSNEIKNEVYVFPTATSLDYFETVPTFFIGVQNAYATVSGSFTGEIGTSQLDEFEIKTILIGHSERRHILGETQNKIAKKYEFYKELGYKIIYCIGEPLEIKNQGLPKTLEYIYGQFDEIDTNYENLILAYEPVWAIGTGVTATNEDIENIHNAIKEKISKPLLYGGSVKVENVREICQIANVDGVLIGTASWKKEDFIQILENTKDL
ncbi:triosephosphate isomerase [Arcobacter venerupis]|uniref:Triosephosphate isomerase n=1 Tax=Arcobacter venerupis TaxID=1054033 RepID=A0AAE7E4U9_9BACT|nr:triose-phosphate isomerase [Arcobacter venerupis]QKF68290.1 triosephosphate isomerase [Arcobacter venerupis]RWS48476.1 triose-phosphate isomerase [Arcobacter venerupis]